MVRSATYLPSGQLVRRCDGSSMEQVQSSLLDGRKDACKTFIEQTKLLVSLGSAFVVAPALVIPLINTSVSLGTAPTLGLALAEVFFVLSILAGYLVVGSIAGTQNNGRYDVYSGNVLWTARIQLTLYLLGTASFAFLLWGMLSEPARPIRGSTASSHLTIEHIGTAPPFQTGDSDLSCDVVLRGLGLKADEFVSIVLVGGGDNSRVGPGEVLQENPNLAQKRAERVRECIEEILPEVDVVGAASLAEVQTVSVYGLRWADPANASP